MPPYLGNLESDYRSYRQYERQAYELLSTLNTEINTALGISSQKTDYEKAHETFRRKQQSLNKIIAGYSTRGKEMLVKQQQEFDLQGWL